MGWIDKSASHSLVVDPIDGTYNASVGIPFYSVCPTSTVDLSLPSGDQITIEERDPTEVTHVGGVGIAPEHLNRLFDKFFRVKSALGRHVVGSGLGLPIARTIVESHGGRIWAESQVGQGSTFYFTLPLRGLSQGQTEQEGQQNE